MPRFADLSRDSIKCGAAPRGNVSREGRAARYLLRMLVSDLDIQRQAHSWIQRHGEGALAKAREMVETMRRVGDVGEADRWLRIIVAIGEMGTPLTDVRY